MDLVQAILQGNRLALTRTLSLVEDDLPEGRTALNELFPHTGRAHLVGVTGAPGTGKSSLVNQLVRFLRNPPTGGEPRKVAIVAVDPTSPFSGGALLGDRIRMRDLAGDPGVFIRSMATRGSLGGLSAATAGLVQVLDAAGFETVLIETVGAGQAEVDIARLAHTTLVIETPGMGDDIQAIKAGILEIADILVINKADLPGVENTERALRGMLELAYPDRRTVKSSPAAQQASGPQPWVPPLLRTVAIEGSGIAELAQAVERHRDFLLQTGEWSHRDRDRLQAELLAILRETLVSRWRAKIPDEHYQEVFELLAARRISPRQAAVALVNGTGPEDQRSP